MNYFFCLCHACQGESVAELFLENSEHQCANYQAFKEEVDSLVQAARESTVSLGQVGSITGHSFLLLSPLP